MSHEEEEVWLYLTEGKSSCDIHFFECFVGEESSALLKADLFVKPLCSLTSPWEFLRSADFLCLDFTPHYSVFQKFHEETWQVGARRELEEEKQSHVCAASDDSITAPRSKTRSVSLKSQKPCQRETETDGERERNEWKTRSFGEMRRWVHALTRRRWHGDLVNHHFIWMWAQLCVAAAAFITAEMRWRAKLMLAVK